MKVRELFEREDEYSELVKALQRHCKQNIHAIMDGKAPVIFRGTNQEPSTAGHLRYFYSKGRTTPRLSASGFNLFLNFTQHSEKWSGVPNRSVSSFATPNFEDADRFGTYTFLVIPLDNVSSYAQSSVDFNKVGIGPHDASPFDIGSALTETAERVKWLSNNGNQESLFADLNISEKESNLLYLLSDLDCTFSMSSIKQISDILEKIRRNMKYLSSSVDTQGELKLAVNYLYEILGDRPLWDFLNEDFTPQNMKIKHADTFSGLKVSRDSEIWFEGDFIGICVKGFPTVNGELLYSKELIETEFFKDIVSRV